MADNLTGARTKKTRISTEMYATDRFWSDSPEKGALAVMPRQIAVATRGQTWFSYTPK